MLAPALIEYYASIISADGIDRSVIEVAGRFSTLDLKLLMLLSRRFGSFRFSFASQLAQAFFAGMARRSRSQRMSACPEVLEVRQVLAATLSATLVNGLLTVSDTSLTDTNNSLTTTLAGTDLVITDDFEQFSAAPAGGTLSNAGHTLTIPANLVTSGLTINAGGGDDFIKFQAIDGAFSANLVVDGGTGNDTVGFGAGAVNVGVGSVDVTAESIGIFSALTAGGGVNLTSTGDDTALTINAPITANGNSKFLADKMKINAAVDVGPHFLTLAAEETVDAGDIIDIGAVADTAANTLAISNSELDYLSAQVILIGDGNSGLVRVSALMEQAGDHNILVMSALSIQFTSGSGWETHDGNISFSASSYVHGQGHTAAIDLDHATLTSTGQGQITLYGKGGLDGAANVGILAHSGTVMQSLGTGHIVMTGFGGTGTSDNQGIQLNDVTITSTSGEIRMSGYGGDGTAGQNGGVLLADTTITATGDFGIFISGTGADGTGHQNGIELVNAQISTTGAGNITLTGHGGDGGDFNVGILARAGTAIESTGTGPISLTGVGGAGTAENRGIQINDANITSTAGDIRLTGQGGQGTDYWNIGVWLVLGANISATGNARIFIDGTAGSGTEDNDGVLFNGFSYFGATKVTAENGDIEIIGHGSTTGTGSSNRGIGVWEGAVIQSTGTAKISLHGTGGTGSDDAVGVALSSAGTKLFSNVGDIKITGQGGTSANAFGVKLVANAIVESTGTAKITINGTGGTGQQSIGVATGSNPRISSVDGDITVIGQGGDALAGDQSRGIGLFSGIHIESTGLAKITLNGTGGAGTSSSRGVEIADSGTVVSSVNGDIQITGQGGDNLYGFGVWLRGGAVVKSIGTAKITVDGTGGAVGGNDSGVILGGYGTGGGSLTSLNGDITVTGHGGNSLTGTYDQGVGIHEGSLIQSTGTARISITGTGGAGIDSQRGVEIGDSGTKVSSVSGDITITGQGGAGLATDHGSFNIGIEIANGAVVESTGAAGVGAKITLNGMSGAGSGSDVGVWMPSGALVSTVLGDITVTGISTSQSGIYNRGVNLEGSSIISTGTAKITVEGTAGGGAGNEIGVYLENSNSIIRSLDGDISVTGRGGTSGGNNNVGVCLSTDCSIESLGTADITVNGTGGQSSDSNIGVWVGGVGSAIRAKSGDITITGVGGQGTSYANIGVVVNQGGVIESTDTARITIAGTGGTGVPNVSFPYGQDGVMVEHANSAIRSKHGDIQITGIAGGDAGSTFNHGVLLKSGVVATTAGGTANISITGTAGPGSTSFGIQVQSDSGTVGINTSAGNGFISLYSDSINIDFVSQPGAISAGTQLVAISPLSSSVGINLGGADTSGSLGLTDAELDRITAGALQFGQGSSTGAVTVTSDITRPAATLFQIFQGSDVFISGGLIDTHGGTLLIASSPAPDAVYPTHAGVDVIANSTNLSPDLGITINGPAVDTGYTQFNVVGGILIGGGKLQLSGSYIPQPNDLFVIVNNDGVEPISGQFDGLDEGTIFLFNGRSLQISYVGGSNGNDVVLTTVNLAPVASDASITTAEDSPVSGTLVATDVDSPILTYSIEANPTHGTVNITNTATGAYTYTPDADYHGTDSFTFRANDGVLNSNTATVSITITAVNDAPQLNLNGGAVTFSGKAAKKDGPTTIVPNITVVDADQSPTTGLGGGTLTISIDASVKTTKNKVKLHDTIGGLSTASALGTTTGALVSNGKLVLTIQLNAGTTTNDIQTFLRGITFSTKGPGLKLTPRTFHAQLTDAAGAASNLLEQTVIVTK